ncbi:MAG: hypothetical protein NZT61_03365 [Deltaproteobacteria bacterium]|nr:hypothetical protein [Deltaproteobacteria bacterium]
MIYGLLKNTDFPKFVLQGALSNIENFLMRVLGDKLFDVSIYIFYQSGYTLISSKKKDWLLAPWFETSFYRKSTILFQGLLINRAVLMLLFHYVCLTRTQMSSFFK